MSYNEYSEKLNRIKQLAKINATGGPKELAKKLNVSERTVYRLIKELDNQGVSLKFCKIKNSYLILD